MTNTLEVRNNFVDVIGQVAEQTEHREFKFGDMKFVSHGSGENSKVVIDGDEYGMTYGSWRQLSNLLEVPVPYAERIPAKLRDTTFNYFINAKKQAPYTALINDGDIRSFMDPANAYVPTKDVFDTIVEVFEGDYDLRYPKLFDVRTEFTLLPLQYKEAIDDSNIYAGLKIVHSDSWASNPSIDTYVWRELCSNGMISELENKKFRVTGKSVSDILQQFHDFAELSLEKIPELIDSYKGLHDEAVLDYARVVTGICTANKISAKVRDRILLYASLPEFTITISDQRIKNMADVVNLFTYVGTHDTTLTDEVREILMSIGGRLTMEHAERCGSCGHTV